MDKLGGARTLEDIESELMFGTLPESDDENGLELDQDEIDAINDETFGGEVAGNDAELEDYAAQTASLRLDDPVWDSAGGGLAEPDASQIPMPVFDSTSFDNLTFGTSPLNSMLAGNFAKGLWDPSSNGLFNLWGESAAGKVDGQESSIFGDLTGKEDSKTDPLAAQLLESSRFGLFGDVPSSSAIQKPATSTRKPDDVSKVQQQVLEDSRVVRPSAHGYKQPILGEEAFPRLVPQSEIPSSRPEVPPHQPQLATQILPSPVPGLVKPPPLPPQAMSAEELERQLLQQNAHTSTANQENSAARIFDLLMPKNIPSTSAKQPQPSPVPGQIPPQLAALQSGQPIPGIAPTQPPPQIPKHGPGGTGAGAAARPPPNQDVMPPLPMVLPPQAPQAAHAYMANLPPLAALPPTFAQLVPIWLVRLTGRTQHLPPTVPPIPSIIGQMYQQVKDPQAVLAITHVLINRGLVLQSMHYQQQQQAKGQEGKSNGPNQPQPPFGGPNRMPMLPPEMIAQMRAAGIPMPAPFANQQQQPMMPGLPPHLQQRSHNQTPTSGMQSGRSSVFQRKPPGMPSVRTIEDLALDQYAGYMSFKEKEWLMKIQTLQCQGPTQDPMIEDYYYTLWKAKKVAEGWKSEQKIEKQQHVEKKTETRQSKDSINDEIRERYRERCRINGERRREEREREKAERRKAREQEKEQSEPRETTTKKEVGSKFAGSLGLPSKSTTNNPRHLIKVGATEMTEEEIARRLASTQKRLRTLLMRLESAILVIIECQDLRSQAPNDQSVQAEISKKIDLILKELFGDELSKVIQINKGRALISRLLKVAAPKDQARAIISMLSMAKNVRKGVMEDVISDVVPSIYASAMGMSRDQMILILSAINVDQLKIDLAEKNLFAREILLTLLLACSKKKASNISLKLFRWLLGPTTNIDWSSGWSSSLASWRQLLKLDDEDVTLLVEWLKLLSLDETSQTIAVQIAAALQTVL